VKSREHTGHVLLSGSMICPGATLLEHCDAQSGRLVPVRADKESRSGGNTYLGLVVPQVNVAIVQTRKQPRLGWVDVHTLDTLRLGRELFLKRGERRLQPQGTGAEGRASERAGRGGSEG
jgi:hypothetical protein